MDRFQQIQPPPGPHSLKTWMGSRSRARSRWGPLPRAALDPRSAGVARWAQCCVVRTMGTPFESASRSALSSATRTVMRRSSWNPQCRTAKRCSAPPDRARAPRGRHCRGLGAALPIAAGIASASPHEVTLAEATIDQIVLEHAPERLIGDRAYDSDPLDERLRAERGIEMIARHRSGRKRPKTQDGRALRRVLHRWKIERLFAWLQNYRRRVTRWEYHAENFLGFVRLGCICILLRQF